MPDIRSLGDYFRFIARPGGVWMTSGERGGGKTHTAVAVMEDFVKHRYPQMPQVVVATNVIFYHRVDGEIRVEPPPGVYHIRTMRDFFPIVVDSIRKYGRDVLIMLVLDEAQGFVGGDNNYTNASIPMKEFLGTIRKYNTLVWFLTPSAKQLGPAFRNLINGNPPGNVTCRWKKDLDMNERWIRANRLPYSPKQLMFVHPYDAMPMFLQVPVTEWTGTVDKLEEGQYCYDHEASATFREGDGFSFNDFNDYMGGVASIHAMDAIERFYRTKVQVTDGDAPAPIVRTQEDIERESKAKLYSRMQINGMTQDEAARMIGVARTTLNEWCKALGLPTGKAARKASSAPPEGAVPETRRTNRSLAPKDARKDTETTPISPGKPEENLRQENGAASTFDDGRKGGSKSSRIYISSRGPQKRGSRSSPSVSENDSHRASETPLSSSAPEGSRDARLDTPLPDGRYSMPEFRRAAEWCTREDA